MEFDQIYSTYFKSVYLYAIQLSGNKHIAEEITSDAFYKAIHSIDKFRGDCDMRIWLCQIAKNTYYSYLKKNKKVLSMDEANLRDFPSSDKPIDVLISNREESQAIRKVLHEMPDPYKEVFMWRVFGELSFKEIGSLHDKTDNWACVTYHRARKIIQSRLEALGYEK